MEYKATRNMISHQRLRLFADYETKCVSNIDQSEKLHKGKPNESVITFSLFLLSFFLTSAFYTYNNKKWSGKLYRTTA
jgi:hypothetical protein